jgi:hypothetical protein
MLSSHTIDEETEERVSFPKFLTGAIAEIPAQVC